MDQIATFVFLDLETTGLPHEELNKTKITELSLIAVKRSHILDTPPQSTPRVLQKLSLCFNPGRFVQPGSTKVTGLCNDLLEYESPFNEAAFEAINSFLSILRQPVCLIAHNGISFDYPILKRQLNVLKVNFSEDLLCADSLHFFYDLDTKLLDTASEPSDVSALTKNNPEDHAVNVDSFISKAKFDMQKQNETTPKKSNCSSNILIKGQKRKYQTNVSELSKVRRKLFYGNHPKPQKSYKLKDVYERLFNRPADNAHHSEADCLMALQCVLANAQKFALWVENNHCQFSNIKPMTVGVQLGY